MPHLVAASAQQQLKAGRSQGRQRDRFGRPIGHRVRRFAQSLGSNIDVDRHDVPAARSASVETVERDHPGIEVGGSSRPELRPEPRPW
jgi:hypothetical protein